MTDNTKSTASVEQQEKKNKTTAWILIILAIALIVVPLATQSGAEFGGTDDQGGDIIEEIEGGSYEPWAEPLMEKALGGEIPGEMESLLFCVQTGIGVGILFYYLGRYTERHKYAKEYGLSDQELVDRQKRQKGQEA
jgi:cobalt/nickel transport protein